MIRARNCNISQKFSDINSLVFAFSRLTIAMRRAATFAAGFGSKLMVLRKTALLIGNASSPLARDFPLFLLVHGGKAPIRGIIILSHGYPRVVVSWTNR
jgi:hypothetical protein